ncbi:olfactory receptor 1J4-like [Sus scrofa]|uniref:olfactory receptor 1J4-like n=1 Tax=Sus scrofa TaxID=9823 RepID=UPI000A2B1D87|nr:olfactory receptor 1J4-like [Sus scrofa]
MMAVYISSSSDQSHDKDIIASMMHTVVTPMLDPFIYSLSNRDMTLVLWILFINNNLFGSRQERSMRRENQSIMPGFILLRLLIQPEQQDNFLLTSMAYDRYVAIFHPLHYATIMREGMCTLLIPVYWIFSCGNALCHILLILSCPFVLKIPSPNSSVTQYPPQALLLRHLPPVYSRSGHHYPPTNMHLGFLCGIGTTIFKVQSTRGICKALSMCGSHISVVSLYYGTIIGLYFVPSSNTSSDKDIVASVMYTVVTPLLNPFIYSLRNRDMKGAMEEFFHKAAVLSQ